MPKLLQSTDKLRLMRQQFEVDSHFVNYTTGQLWTSLAGDAGASAALADAHGGILLLTTGAVDNNEAGVFTTKELFLFGADKPLEVECKMSFTDMAASAGMVAFGVGDALGANLLTDDTGVPSITTTGALIYKVDGGSVWRCYSKNGAAVNDTASTRTAGGAQRLCIDAYARDTTSMELVFLVDGEALVDSNGRAIKHTLPYASAGEMKLGAYAKSGAAAGLVLSVDFIYGAGRL